MSSASKFVAVLVAGRAAGSKSPSTGVQHGGIYYPEHLSNGKKVTARWEGNVYINGMNYTDPTTGESKEGKSEVIRVVAWNGQNAKPGGGLADLCAKAIAVGKEFSCELDVNTFKKRLFIDDKPQTDHLGREILINGTSFTMRGLPIWGNDADSVIQAEINNYRTTGQATFASRPPFWNVVNHADAAIWDVIKKSRKATQYIPGSATYGHARTVLPVGAQLINATGQPVNPAAMPGLDPNMMAMLQALMAGQMPAAPTPVPVAPPTPAVPAGIDPVMMANLLAAFGGGVPAAPSVPPVTTAAGAVLNGQMPI